MPNLRSLTIGLAYLVISAQCGLYYCSLSPTPDQSIFDYMAWQGLHGVQWYAGSFDVTWPGSLLIHEVGIRLFGVHRWTARLTDFVLLQPTILAMYFFLRSMKLYAAAIAVAFAYPIIYVTSGAWMAGHRDIVAMHALIISASILLAYRADERVRLFISGLVVGYAVMIRPTYLAFAPFLLIVDLLGPGMSFKRALTMTIALGMGTSVFPAIFLVGGVVTGTFDAWLAATRFVFDVYPVSLSRDRLLFRFLEISWVYFAWLSAVGVGSAIFWLTADRFRPAFLLLGMALTSVISYVAQNKGFGYHLGGLIPVFTMSTLGGINSAFVSSRATRKPAYDVRRVLAVALAVTFCIGLERRAQNNFLPYDRSAVLKTPSTEGVDETTRQAVSIITHESETNAYFFQWGWNYDVGFLSERLAASRFLNTPLLSLITKDNVAYQPWLTEFDRDLTNTKPTFVLLDLSTVPKGIEINDNRIQLPIDAKGTGLGVLVSHLNAEYAVRFRWKDRILFKRI